MKITKVEAIPLFASFADALDVVPPELSQPAFSMRNNSLLGQGAVIVRVETDEGLAGIGEAMGRPGPRGTAAHINEVLAPMLLGVDPRHYLALWTAMNEGMRFAPMGISGVDIALWDLRGKLYGDSLVNLLGGPMREMVDCYASPIPYMATAADSAERARAFLRRGFHAVKLKIGRGLGRDIAHVEAVREAVGADIKLLVDANGAYTVSEAVALAKDLVKLGVYWLEEPVHPEYPDDLARIRRRVDLPVASGEWLGAWHQFRDLLKAEAVDVIMPNITRCGGITGMMKIADLAALENVTVAPHGVGAGIGIVAAVAACAVMPNFLIYEYNQLFNPLRHTVMREAIHFAEGALKPNDGAGLGLSLDERTLARYRVDRLSD
ncbi:MAG: mandelate racemase/muconate lactonizing enzyme family protein [Chloroflexota bacterium]|nr:mandelate racemase/muconate lactonizing enzyme family protein [Chloroflexota bacterium]MDE2948904.1 mandelate racemase/muconate lactonizing enzyme family protein [Chloroflexota bacterium]